MTALPTLSQVAALLLETRLPLKPEKATQAAIHALLAERLPPSCELEREFRLSSRDVPDFLVAGCWAIEIKANSASASATLRQLERYAAHEQVRGLILASNRAMVLPALIGGKPLVGVSLGRAWL